MQKIEYDLDNERAVLMGEKEGIVFVYMINIVICILFVIVGILMVAAARPSLALLNHLETGRSRETVPGWIAQQTSMA